MKSYAYASFGLSFLTHAFVIICIPSFASGRISPQPVKVQPVREKSEVKITPQKTEPDKMQELMREVSDIPVLPYIEDFTQKLILDDMKVLSLDKPQPAQERIREVAIADMPDKNLRKLPEYMDYYQLIRTKIAKTAQRLYDGEDGGTIFVSFTVLPDGRLGDVYLEENSAKSKHLREVAIESIHEASPFPSFPKELAKRSSLPVSIPINFKNN